MLIEPDKTKELNYRILKLNQQTVKFGIIMKYSNTKEYIENNDFVGSYVHTVQPTFILSKHMSFD